MENQQMINFATFSSPSSSFVTPLKKYDIFLSFRGEDTRDNFISHLYGALCRVKAETYIDYRLDKGDEIKQALIKAIKDSLVSLVIFSENYASSKWCLDGITLILECMSHDGQIVIPVFYKVDPSHVRKQIESYEKAFAKHEQDLNISVEKLQKWKCALTEAANLAGWDYGATSRNEYEFIKDIVEDVLQKLNMNIRYPIDQLKGVVGIEENYAMVESLLEIGSTDDVRVIGLWGMGGVGKTTLTRVLYAKLSIQFEGHCFLENVNEQSKKNGLDVFRNRLLSLLAEENLCVKRRHKVFIVLDDVATSEQFEYLIRNYDYLAPGSRVIVTTRDIQILSPVNGIHEVKGLNDRDSLHLFCLNTFGEKHPKNGYEELSVNAIAYCDGNPLALKVLGGGLRSKNIEAWESALRKLQKYPDVKIHHVLKSSFDGLNSYEKNIFLDIACLLKGGKKDDVTSLLHDCGNYGAATHGITDLIDNSLLNVAEFGKIEMHDLIQEMGRNVVRQESDKDPGRRSRLWDHDEVCHVLKYNKGTEAVEGIILDVSKIEKDLHLSSDSFAEMTLMRILKFYSSVPRSLHSQSDRAEEFSKIYLPNGLKSLPYKLSYFQWHGYCLESLPSTFCPENLVKLDMRYSNLKKLWGGVQKLVNLKEIDLTGCKDLVELPDLSQAPNLEQLFLNDCVSLREVHPSIFSLHKLWNMDLGGCTKIESLETEVHLKSLARLDLSNCSSLKKFSVFSEKLEKLQLGGTSIHELPMSIWRCEKVTHMSLRGCNNLMSFGSKSSHDPVNGSLTYLDLSGCKLVNESNLCLILDGMRSLTKLFLEDCCNLWALPYIIGSSTSLEYLSLSGSINVEKLSPNMKNLLKLKELRLDNCKKLMSLPELPSSLQQLSAINCTSLQRDFTQLMPVVEPDISRDNRYVILPGAQVPEMFRFRGKGNSITFPQLPHSGSICHLICCVVLSHILPDIYYGSVRCYLNEHSIDVASVFWVEGHTSILDHVLLCSTDKYRIGHLFGCGPNNITFEFSYRTKGASFYNDKIEIMGCGVFPVYASQNLQQTISTVLSELGCKRKSPSFKKEENSRPEKHIIPYDTPSTSNIDFDQIIEASGGKDLSNNQVDKCSEQVIFEKPDWDPIESKSSSDSYKVSPMSTHSTCISQTEAMIEELDPFGYLT